MSTPTTSQSWDWHLPWSTTKPSNPLPFHLLELSPPEVQYFPVGDQPPPPRYQACPTDCKQLHFRCFHWQVSKTRRFKKKKKTHSSTKWYQTLNYKTLSSLFRVRKRPDRPLRDLRAPGRFQRVHGTPDRGDQRMLGRQRRPAGPGRRAHWRSVVGGQSLRNDRSAICVRPSQQLHVLARR